MRRQRSIMKTVLGFNRRIPIARLILCVLCGFAVEVVVSLILIAAAPVTFTGVNVRGPTPSSVDENTVQAYVDSRPGGDGFRFYISAPNDGTLSPDTCRMFVENGFPSSLRDLADPVSSCINEAISSAANVEALDVAAVTYGWPMRCFYVILSFSPSYATSINKWTTQTGMVIGSDTLLPSGAIPIALPLGVRIDLLALNIIICALTLWLAGTTWRWLVGIRRNLAAVCAECGYDVRFSTGKCPECGKEIAHPIHKKPK